MDEHLIGRKDKLLYWFFAVLGTGLLFLSFWIRGTHPNSEVVDLSLNVGATLISTAVLAFLYQRFGSEKLIHQIDEIRRSLTIVQCSHELGIREMWRERRQIPGMRRQNSGITWNKFTESAQSEVWLLGMAEEGFAQDPTFHRIVSDGTARGCHYRFLILDPASAAVEEIERRTGQQLQGRIRNALSQFQLMQEQNAGKQGQVEVLVYAYVPQVSIVRSDDELLVTPYMAPLDGNSCITFHVQNVSDGVFEKYIEHFEATWKSACAPTTVTH